MSQPLEKRIHPRKHLRTQVVFEDEFGDGLFYVYSEDVSLGGLFLASDIPVRTGTLLFLSFEMPGYKRPLRITGEVVRKENSGFGIRFVGLADIAKERIKEYLG